MWGDEVVESLIETSPLQKTKEVLGARKAAESTRCAEGRYEMAIPWKDNEPPMQYIRKTT